MASDAIERLMRERRHTLPGEVEDFTVQDMQEITQVVQSVTGILTAFLSAVAAISLLAAVSGS